MRWMSQIALALATVMLALSGISASAELVYVSEELHPFEQNDAAFLNDTESIDGMDPITYHRLRTFPKAGDAVVLWQGRGEQLTWVQDYGFTDTAGFEMIMDAKLPAGGDVLYQVWSIEQQELVDSFVHIRTQAPWAIDLDEINRLPRGHYALIALIRTQNEQGGMQVRAQYNQDIRVADEHGLPALPELDLDLDLDLDLGLDGQGPGLNLDLGQFPLQLSDAGFTEFDQSKAGQIIYVSSSTGNNNNDGLSPQTAVRTPREGYNRLRSFEGDWLLFKAGDVFTSGIGKWDLAGEEDRPMLVGVYGEGNRPKFNLDDDSLVYGTDGIQYVAFVGLEATQYKRNPSHPEFDEDAANSTAMGFAGDASHILIEDCKISYFAKGMVFADSNNAQVHDITVRRNIIRYCWNSGDRGAGIYTNRVRNMRVEENLIDHNGWHPDIAAGREGGLYQRGFQAHGCYFSGRYNSGVGNGKWDKADNDPAFVIEFHGNIVSRSSANGCQFRLGGNVSDNVFFGNPMAFYTWTNPSSAHRNAILGGTHVDYDAGNFYRRGWGIQVIAEGEYSENVIANVSQASAGSHAIVYEHSGAKVHNNVFYNWRAANRDSAVWNKNGSNEGGFANNITEQDGVDFIDPTRDLDSYYRNGGAEAFLDAAAMRPRGVWVQEYDAEAISGWIRAGFETK